MSGVKTYDWPKKLRLGPPVKSQNDNHGAKGRYKKSLSFNLIQNKIFCMIFTTLLLCCCTQKILSSLIKEPFPDIVISTLQ